MMPDPRFPDRPTHPDFARLSEVVIRLDAESDHNGHFGTLEGFIDRESAVYMAESRAKLAAMMLNLPQRVETALAASFIDGLVAGIRFQQDKERS